MNKLLITIICCFFNLLLGYGQTSVIGPDSNKPFESIRRIQNKHGEYSKIEFWDSTSNSLIKTLDLVQLSPYCNLPETQIRLSEAGTPIYKLPVKRNNNDPKRQYYYPHTEHISTDTLYLASTISLSRENNEAICVAFSLVTSANGPFRSPLSYISTLLVFNKKGEEKGRITNIKADPYGIYITDSSDYIFYKTGIDTGEGISNIPPGIHVMDIKNQQLIFSSNQPINSGVSVLEGKLFFITNPLPGQGIEYQIIDPVDRTSYTKVIDYRKTGVPKAIDTQKCVFVKEKTNKTTTYFYDQDFVKHKFITNFKIPYAQKYGYFYEKICGDQKVIIAYGENWEYSFAGIMHLKSKMIDTLGYNVMHKNFFPNDVKIIDSYADDNKFIYIIYQSSMLSFQVVARKNGEWKRLFSPMLAFIDLKHDITEIKILDKEHVTLTIDGVKTTYTIDYANEKYTITTDEKK